VTQDVSLGNDLLGIFGNSLSVFLMSSELRHIEQSRQYAQSVVSGKCAVFRNYCGYGRAGLYLIKFLLEAF
jgi:hypothetical protein